MSVDTALNWQGGNRGDLVCVPAWCSHAITNISSAEDLILMSLTNLPQQEALGNVCAHEPEDAATPIPLTEQTTRPMSAAARANG